MDEHERWFRQKLESPGAYMYMAYLKTEKIGIIHFDIDVRETMVSVMLNPENTSAEDWAFLS